MSNPYASFAASDDEEDTKVNVVKGEPKQKRSTNSSKQPIKTNESSRNSRMTMRRRPQKLQRPPSTSHSPKRPKSPTNMPIWKDPRLSGNVNWEKATSTTKDPAPAESTFPSTQGPTPQSWRRIRKRGQRQGSVELREVPQERGPQG